MKLVTSKDQCLFGYEVYSQLVEQKLATKSFNEELNLVTFKYAKKVMFDRLWNKHPALMECRGITFDATTKELKALPFRKSFNYLENDWWKGVPLSTKVRVSKKYNGFMGCVSNVGGLVYSTTGSTKSDFVSYIKDCTGELSGHEITEGWSYLFECMHSSDPHIVKEDVEVAQLGARNNSTGVFSITNHTPAGRFTLEDVLQDAKTDKGEGWMVYHPDDEFCLSPAKVKSDYYVGKKKLMRMTPKNVELMYRSPESIAQMLPERWKEFPAAITKIFGISWWLNFNDQARREVIEELEKLHE